MIWRRRIINVLTVIFVAYIVYAISVNSNNIANDNLKQDGGTSTSQSVNPSTLSLNMLDGGTKKMSDFKGKVVVLDFWASWCGPCRMSVPEMNELTKSYAGKDVVVIGVNCDEDKSAAKQGVEELGMKYQVAWDEGRTIQKCFGVDAYPTVIVLDKNNKQAGVTQGYIANGTAKTIRQHVDRLLQQ